MELIMNYSFFINIFIIIVITICSGIGDSQGFVHAANIWHKGRIVWAEVLKSSLGFSVGIFLYWIVIKFLNDVGIKSAELQTIGWFSVTIIGVALSSGKFFQWDPFDQIIAIGILSGIAWLMVRNGG